MNPCDPIRALAALLLTASLASAQAAPADAPLLGSWQGTLVAGPQRLEVALHVKRDGDGYAASFDSITQGARDIPVTTLTFTDGELTAVLPIGAKFVATLQPGADDARGDVRPARPRADPRLDPRDDPSLSGP